MKRESRQQSRQTRQSRQVQQKKAGKDSFYIIIAGMIIVGIIAIAGVGLYNRGVPQRYTTAITIGNERISVGAYNFYQRSSYNYFLQSNYDYLQYLGLDTMRPLDQQLYSADETWADFFKEQTFLSAQRDVAFAAEAKKANKTLKA